MPLSLSDLKTPQTKEQIQETLTGFLVTLGFPVTAWQDGGAARGFLEMMSELGSSFTERVATLANAVDLETAAGEFLDVKARSDYDETRSAAVATILNVSMNNTGGTTHGPIAAGELVVRAPNGELYSSTASATITASTVTVVEFRAQTAGAAGNVGAVVMQLVTPLAGVSATTDGTLTTSGADAEDDERLRARCRTKWGALRVEIVKQGVENLVLNSSSSIAHVAIDDSNPRGAGTADVYIAADGAASGSGDVTLAQAALDSSFLGNGSVDQLVQAIAATIVNVDVTMTVYVSGITATEAQAAVDSAIADVLADSPIGGFDLSPGPSNVVTPGHIVDAVTTLAGVVSVSMSAPAADVVLSPSEKALAGTVAATIVVVSGG